MVQPSARSPRVARSVLRKALLPLLLIGTSLLGGCYVAPYPAYPVYGGGYYAGYAAPAVVVAGPFYRGRYWR